MLPTPRLFQRHANVARGRAVKLRALAQARVVALMSVTVCGAASCTLAGDGDTGSILSADDRAAIAGIWTSPAVLSIQERPSCDSVAVARSTTRCGSRRTLTSNQLDHLSSTASTLASSLRRTRTSHSLHATALIDAGIGGDDGASLDRTVASLDEASALDSTSVHVQVDRAAVRLQRYAMRHDVVDVLVALDAAAKATALAPGNWHACWNTALALTWVGARHAARTQWSRCSALPDARAIPAMRDSGSAVRDTSRALALTGRWHEASREYAWTVVLPMWGRAIRAGNSDSTEVALRLLSQLMDVKVESPVEKGLALRLLRQLPSAGVESPGEESLARAQRDVVMSTQRGASPTRAARMGRAFELLAIARSSEARGNPALAAGALDSAMQLSSPTDEVRRWILLQRANQLLIVGRATEARAAYRRLRNLDGHRLTVFGNRVAWGETLTAVALGEAALSLTQFHRVADQCRALLLEGCMIGAATFSTEIASQLGDDEQSARELQRAIDAMTVAPTSTWTWSAMLLLRKMADARGYSRAAAVLNGEVLALAEQLGQPDLAMEAMYSRASSRLEAGDTRGAQADLLEARRNWLPTLSVADRAWFTPDLLRIEGELQRESQPARARLLLDSAIALLGADENETRGTEIRFSHAKAVLAAGDTATALAELNDVLTTLVGRGTAQMTVFERARLATVTAGASVVSAQVLRRRGEPFSALQALSGRAFASVSAAAPVCCTDDRARQLAMRQVGDSVWVFAHGASGVRLTVVALPARDVTAAGALDSVALVRVYDAVVRPFVAIREDGETTVRLDVRGALSAVPWAAVRDERHGQYLIEQTAILLVNTDAEPRAQLHRTFGSPAAGGRAFRAPPLGHRAPRTRTVVALIDAAPRHGPRALPGAAREITALDGVWGPRAFRVDGSRGATFSVSHLGAATVVHFAGHAVLDHGRPERSYLSLPAIRDSVIRGDQVTRKVFGRVRLVILSACETRGFTPAAGGQSGFDSLAGAFLDAGVETVIGAQWVVDDAATVQVMTWVHTALRDGQLPAEALRSAQRAAMMAADPALRAPRVWAGVVGMGR